MVAAIDVRLRSWLEERPAPVLRRTEALAFGYTDRMIRRRVESGWWTTIERGLYDVSARSDPWRTALACAVVKLPAVVSHHSAAELHRFPMTPRGRLSVTVPHRSTHSHPGVVVHQSTDLSAEYICRVGGFPTTTAERTVLDIAHGHRLGFLVALIESLIVAELITPETMRRTVKDLGRRGRPGTVKTREALARVIPEVTELESELERLVLRLIRDAGLRLPELQFPIPWRASRPGRVDMAFVEERVVIECDGRRWHTAATTFEDDRKRDNEATLAGWKVIRITWKMATEEPTKVVASIRQALSGSV